jgi:hypothetical protein
MDRLHRQSDHAEEGGDDRWAGVTLATLDNASRGAVWLPDDTIIFATASRSLGCSKSRRRRAQ